MINSLIILKPNYQKKKKRPWNPYSVYRIIFTSIYSFFKYPTFLCFMSFQYLSLGYQWPSLLNTALLKNTLNTLGKKKNHWNPDENFDFYYSHWSPCHQVILLESAQEYPFWKGQSTGDDLKKKKKVKFLFPLLLDFHISCPLI